MKLIILDRDGVINFDSDLFIKSPAEWKPIPGSLEAIVRLKQNGYRVVVATNQSGIGRGYYTLADAERCNARLVELLGLGADVFTDICIAPEAPDQPAVYRKPSPRFILESIARHGLDPAHSWMVGDRESDLLAGLNAGIRAAGVCTGKYDAAAWASRLPAGAVLFADLPAFVASLR